VFDRKRTPVQEKGNLIAPNTGCKNGSTRGTRVEVASPDFHLRELHTWHHFALICAGFALSGTLLAMIILKHIAFLSAFVANCFTQFT
jgi:hypothetical protein